MNRETAIQFVAAINAHDVNRIIALMADDHQFIDAYGNSTGKEAMQQGWQGYFAWFPNYCIEVNEVFTGDNNTVVLLGFASGTYQGKTSPNHKNHWRIPAAWRVVVKNKKVSIWQVYADSKIPFDSMESGIL